MAILRLKFAIQLAWFLRKAMGTTRRNSLCLWPKKANPALFSSSEEEYFRMRTLEKVLDFTPPMMDKEMEADTDDFKMMS